MDVVGEIERPEGSFIGARRTSQFRTLTQVRTHMRRELIASIDDI